MLVSSLKNVAFVIERLKNMNEMLEFGPNTNFRANDGGKLNGETNKHCVVRFVPDIFKFLNQHFVRFCFSGNLFNFPSIKCEMDFLIHKGQAGGGKNLYMWLPAWKPTLGP